MKIPLLLLSFSALFANSLVVYNNLAFVQEEKNVTILDNYFYINNLSFDIIDSSIAIYPKTTKILSYEMHKPQDFVKEILKKNLHKEIKFLFNKKILAGTLLQIEPKIIVSDSNHNLYMISTSKDLIVKEPLNNYQKNPFLKVKLKPTSQKKEHITMQYLMRSISWKSNYIVTLKKSVLNLQAFIEVNNQSKKSFHNYQLSFVAGKINTLQAASRVHLDAVAMVKKRVTTIASAQKIASYYLYRLPYRITLPKTSKKFFKLFDYKDIPYRSYYKLTSYFFNRYEQNLIPKMLIEFKNSTNAPLPQGEVRVYKRGIYVGADYIYNKSKNDLIKLSLGEAFDIKIQKKILEYQENKNYKKQKVAYSITNSSNEKKELVMVEKISPIRAKEINFKSSCKVGCHLKKLDAFSREYTLTLEPNSTKKFTVSYEIFY